MEKKDKKFKEIINVDGFEKKKLKVKRYNPDAVFIKDDSIIVFESSSNKDRKAHIGEMIQFLIHVVGESKYNNCYFVLYLCCKGSGAPTVDKEKERLQDIYDKYPLSKKNKEKIKLIAITDQFKVDFSQSLNILDIEKYTHLDLQEKKA